MTVAKLSWQRKPAHKILVMRDENNPWHFTFHRSMASDDPETTIEQIRSAEEASFDAVREAVRRIIIRDQQVAVEAGEPLPMAPNKRTLRGSDEIKKALQDTGGKTSNEAIGVTLNEMERRRWLRVDFVKGPSGGAKRGCMYPPDMTAVEGVPKPDLPQTASGATARPMLDHTSPNDAQNPQKW